MHCNNLFKLSLQCLYDALVSMTYKGYAVSAHTVDVLFACIIPYWRDRARARRDIEEKEIWKIYRAAYGDERHIRLIRDKKGLYKFPDPKFLVGSNFCDIGFDIDRENNRLVVLSASDNLMKGAAGSAIQNMNVMFGLDESVGISHTPLTPV